MPITTNDITIAGFPKLFRQIVSDKEKAGIRAVEKNPTDLLQRAKTYGTRYKNESWGWASNVWSRSAASTDVVDDEEDLKPEHKKLMLAVLERALCAPLIQADASLGSPGSKTEMHCRLFCDPQFPDLPHRWQQLNFPGNPSIEPDAVLFCIPHYLNNPPMPGAPGKMLMVMRFPNHGYSIVTGSSYHGEIKKGFLSHWILHAYRKGGTGEHASLKEFTVKRPDGSLERIVMGTWGLTGSGKSTHGLYVITDEIAKKFREKFSVAPSEFISEQALKNDDITAWFEDRVLSPEKGSWTKTEDVDENQYGIFRAARNPRALHENTEWDENGDVSFEGKLFQYQGTPNRNARTVLQMEDTGYFDGSVDSTSPPNMAVFISPGYLVDFAWLRIEDTEFAAKVLADGRTVGHPAQSLEGVGETKYATRYCLPFTMGVTNTEHVERFHQFLSARKEAGNPIAVYQINTTGRVGTDYRWETSNRDGKEVRVPKVVFEERNGRREPRGGTGPSIEETELFLMQAARGAVEYEPHPIWGKKVMVPRRVPGLSEKRLRELNPFTYRSPDEAEELLRSQAETSKQQLDSQCPGLDEDILGAMDF